MQKAFGRVVLMIMHQSITLITENLRKTAARRSGLNAFMR